MQEERELINLETGLGLIDREWIGNRRHIVNTWTLVWERELPLCSGGSRYWFALMKDKQGNEAFRILEIDERGIAHHLRVPRDEMFHFLVELSLWMKAFERLNDGQPLGRYGPAVVERHEMPRLMQLKAEMIPGAKYRSEVMSYCPGHLGLRCDGKIHTCNLCGARCGWCYKNHEGYEYLR